MHDFKKFQPLRQKLIDNVDKMLAEEVSRLMSMVPTEESEMPAPSVQGGAFEGMKENPFNLGANEGRRADSLRPKCSDLKSEGGMGIGHVKIGIIFYFIGNSL